MTTAKRFHLITVGLPSGIVAGRNMTLDRLRFLQMVQFADGLDVTVADHAWMSNTGC